MLLQAAEVTSWCCVQHGQYRLARKASCFSQVVWAGFGTPPLTFKLLKSSPGGMTFMKGMCLPVRRRYLNTFSSLLSYLQGEKSSPLSGNI